MCNFNHNTRNRRQIRYRQNLDFHNCSNYTLIRYASKVLKCDLTPEQNSNLKLVPIRSFAFGSRLLITCAQQNEALYPQQHPQNPISFDANLVNISGLFLTHWNVSSSLFRFKILFLFARQNISRSFKCIQLHIIFSIVTEQVINIFENVFKIFA